MDENSKLKINLLKALKESNYKVVISEPNNVELLEKYDGTSFLLVTGDDATFGVDPGCCSITILGHTFTCEFEFGEWSADNDEDEWLLDDSEFMDALMAADGVIFGEQVDLDSQAMVFCIANNLSVDDTPYYCCEDTDIPKNINSMDCYPPVPSIVAVVMNNGEATNVECNLQCESIYNLYCKLKEKELLFNSPTISSAFIKSEVPNLFQEIIDEFQYCDFHDAGVDEINFTLENTKEFFESVLG